MDSDQGDEPAIAELSIDHDSSTHDVSRPASASASDSDDDFKRHFSGVVERIHFDRIPSYCARIRQQHDRTDTVIEVSIGKEPLFGSYHVLYAINFDDGKEWLLKIPACGTPSLFKDIDAIALRSEAGTMQLLRRSTSIPVPEVFAYDASLDNELGCPFILMQFVPGLSLADAWFDKECSPERLLQRRSKTLSDIAAAMAQLRDLTFDSGGTLTYNEDGQVDEVISSRLLDHAAMLKQVFEQEDDDNATCAPIYLRAGPWTTPLSFYTRYLDNTEVPDDPDQQASRRLLRMMLDHIPEPQDSRKKFVLAHPDYDIQNFIVSKDGSLQAIIDWDGVEAVPRSVGYESYPGWLTRDWDPAMYGWNESMEQGVKPEGCWEDSPQTLASLRSDYEEYMRSALSSQPDQQSHVQRTANSLYVENLLIATSSPVCTNQILEKFIDCLRDLQDQNPPENFTFEDLVDTLVEGELDDAQAQYLKHSLAILFSTVVS